jgi:hypothetical protein
MGRRFSVDLGTLSGGISIPFLFLKSLDPLGCGLAEELKVEQALLHLAGQERRHRHPAEGGVRALSFFKGRRYEAAIQERWKGK